MWSVTAAPAEQDPMVARVMKVCPRPSVNDRGEAGVPRIAPIVEQAGACLT